MSDKKPAAPTTDTGDRLAKVIARSGLCSRRDAEEWIAAGRVYVNSKVVKTPAFNVTDRDRIVVDGLPLADREGTRVWLYHKPAGLVVTEKDPEGRPTVFEDVMAQGMPRVVSIGRLDINTEGLLLLTNDGGLKRVLELPATGWLRRYRVRAFGSVTQQALDNLKNGITIDGIKYGPIEAEIERDQGPNIWLTLGLREGKNREVKNVLGALGLQVNRLIRVSYGPFQLGDLPVGKLEVVRARVLKEQLGKRLAAEANVDFEGELPNRADPNLRLRDNQPNTTIALGKQRFRFTDRTEMTEEEVRLSRPRKDRPGGARTGTNKPFVKFEERKGPSRLIHFDDDGRAPEEFTGITAREELEAEENKGKPRGAGAPRGEGAPRGAGAPRGPRKDGDAPRGARPARAGDDGARSERAPRGDRGDAPRGDRGKPNRSFGDKPARGSFGDKPARAFGDKPARPYGDKPARGPRPDGDRPARSFGDKPARGPRPDGDRPKPNRSFGDKPARAYGDKPARGPRPDGDRPARAYGDKPTRPQGDRPARPYGDKPARGPRPEGDRPARSYGDKPARPAGDRPARSYGDKPARPAGDRPARAYGDKPAARAPSPDGDRKPYAKKDGGAPASRGPRPVGGKPAGGKPYGKPAGAGGRPGGKPAGAGRPPKTRT